jgi:hypothetical protein
MSSLNIIFTNIAAENVKCDLYHIKQSKKFRKTITLVMTLTKVDISSFTSSVTYAIHNTYYNLGKLTNQPTYLLYLNLLQ